MVFIYGRSFIFAESDLILLQELIQNLGLAAVGVFIVTIFMLVHPLGALLTVFSVFNVDLFLIGQLWIAGMRLNSVTVISLVMVCIYKIL